MISLPSFFNLQDSFPNNSLEFINELKKRCRFEILHELRPGIYRILLMGFDLLIEKETSTINIGRYFTGMDNIKQSIPSIIHDFEKLQEFDQYFCEYKYTEFFQSSGDYFTAKQLFKTNGEIFLESPEFYDFSTEIRGLELPEGHDLQKLTEKIESEIAKIPLEHRFIPDKEVVYIYFNILMVYCLMNRNITM